jgi:Fe-S-cluster containining protein
MNVETKTTTALTPGHSAESAATKAPPRLLLRAPRLRLAILGASPCDLCTAACCKQNGHTYAARLQDDEVRKFAPFAIDVPILNANSDLTYERVLPYIHGRCQFLGDDDRCTIYDDRPRACRRFQCIDHYNADGIGAHDAFLQRNPRVRELLDSL